MGQAESESGNLKGAVAAGFVYWLEQEHGRDAVLAGVARLPPAEQELYRLEKDNLGILPGSWYPAEQLHRLLDALTADIPPEEFDAVARGAGDAIIATVMTGLQKGLFALLMTPDRYVKYINRIWSQNSDSGLVNIASEPGMHHSTITDWRAHHPLVCRMVVYGKLRIYAAMGCKDPSAEVIVCDARAGCQSLVRWSE